MRRALLVATVAAAALAFAAPALAGPATHFTVAITANPQAGKPTGMLVTARDAANAVATGYRGTVHFTSSDTHAQLPSNYTFTAADAGKHGFGAIFHSLGSRSVTVRDVAASSISGTGSTTVQAQQLCGTLTADKVLSPADSPYYLLTCNLVVPVGKTLTADPGTAVVALAHTGINASGNIVSSGTAAKPVYFLDVKQYVGGPPARGDWNGINVVRAGTSAPPNVALDYTQVFYAHVTAINVDSAAIQHSLVYAPHGRGIDVKTAPTASVLNIWNNAVRNGDGVAMHVQSDFLSFGSLTGNAATGNALNELQLAGTWLGGGPPLTGSGITYAVATGETLTANGDLAVASGAKLELHAGSTVRFGDFAGLVNHGTLRAVGTAASRITLAPAVPTHNWPGVSTSRTGALPRPNVTIRFANVSYAPISSSNANVVDLQSNNVSQAPGTAVAVSSDGTTAPIVRFNAITAPGGPAISVAGTLAGSVLGGNTGPGIPVGTTDVVRLAGTITGGTLSSAATNGLAYELAGGAAASVTGTLTVADNAALRVRVATLSFAESTELTVHGDLTVAGLDGSHAMFLPIVAEGNWDGIHIQSTVAHHPSVQFVNADVDGAGILSTGAASFVANFLTISSSPEDGLSLTETVNAPSVEATTISGSAGMAAYVSGDSTTPGGISGIGGTGNGHNHVAIQGTIAGGTLSASDTDPLDFVAPTDLRVTGGLTVAPGATLRLPQTFMRFNSGVLLTVQGSLDADNASLAAYGGASGGWAGISVAGPGGSIALANATVVEDAGISASGNASVSITGSTVTETPGTGIAITGATTAKAPTVTDNTITDCGGNAITIDSGTDALPGAQLSRNSGTDNGAADDGNVLVLNVHHTGTIEEAAANHLVVVEP